MVDEDSESLNSWTITGTKYVAGRKCVILKEPLNYIDDVSNEEYVGYVTFCIDTETGLCLERTQEYTSTVLDTLETSKYEASTQANSITYNDNTGFVTGAQFKDFLKDFTPKGEFANDINYMSCYYHRSFHLRDHCHHRDHNSGDCHSC